MSDNNDALNQAAADASTDAAQAPKAKVVLTKEEKIAKLDEQIAKLQERRTAIIEGREPAVKAKAPAFDPAVGEKVIAKVGRTTATTQAEFLEGTVIAVKEAEIDAETGKAKGAKLYRVRVKEGTFEEQITTLYAAFLSPVGGEDAGKQEPEQAEPSNETSYS